MHAASTSDLQAKLPVCMCAKRIEGFMWRLKALSVRPARARAAAADRANSSTGHAVCPVAGARATPPSFHGDFTGRPAARATTTTKGCRLPTALVDLAP